MASRLSPLLFLFVFTFTTAAQPLPDLTLSTTRGVAVRGYVTRANEIIRLSPSQPFFTFLLNDTLVPSTTSLARSSGDSVVFHFRRGLEGSVRRIASKQRGWAGVLSFRNVSRDTLVVANVVPLGEGPDRVYITATGPSTWPNWLSRSSLFRPGHGPLGVVLPDNAWELGFCDVAVSRSVSLVGLARRWDSQNASERRFRTVLPPGGSVRYHLWIDDHTGDWHNGLRIMFRERWLYDLTSFDESLYKRADLQWVRHAYLMTLLFAWDKDYRNTFGGARAFERFLDFRSAELGPYDVFVLWPTWPRLGVDQRNQFDLYRDLPGGLDGLLKQSTVMHQRGGKFFVSYNPWDESTRKEQHLRGMTDLLRATNADGVVLDTWGNSSIEFQAAVDSVRPGIVLYSEGMAVPQDLPGIVTGRVHDALFMPPPLNMNKYIRPDCAIFRVMQAAEGRLHREAAVCLFNGYGVELNVMRTGRPSSLNEDYRYIGRVVKILRDNSTAFLSQEWEPIIPSSIDSIWVNRWPTPLKTVYTVYSLRPEGYDGPLFPAPIDSGHHFVSLWHHRELRTMQSGKTNAVPVLVHGFSRSWLGTRKEGNVDCIASLRTLLTVARTGDSIFVDAPHDSVRVVVSAGDPGYATNAIEFTGGSHTRSILSMFGPYEGKIVVQLYDQNELLDERILEVPPGTPYLLPGSAATDRSSTTPRGMKEIPGGVFAYSVSSREDPNPVIPAPDQKEPVRKIMHRYFIDTYPVTNLEFLKFLASSGYRPKDSVNFLRHWRNRRPLREEEQEPVVWVSLEDARAYAQWAGKRLPTDVEWQYAAQGDDGRTYPWGNSFDSTRCNCGVGRPTQVDAYPTGKSPFGVEDLIGNVWQLTDDVYDNGSYQFVMMRGGSYFDPTSSIWYVKGGPRPVTQHQMLLLVSPGLDRNATVGFRCVMDAK